MSGSLNLVSSVSVSSATATVSLTGIDSTYNVYKVIGSNLRPASAAQLEVRLTKGGSVQSDSEYDWAYLGMYTGGTFVHEGSTGADSFFVYNAYEETTGTGRGNGFIMYLFNFNESEYSQFTLEQTYSHSTGAMAGNQGGCIHTVASASDGIQFLWDGGHNFEQGDFKLYGLSK
tara:strand:- start:487 stop:1008 length:522 start_codon:yes stop_codon:yes gene_type:complete